MLSKSQIFMWTIEPLGFIEDPDQRKSKMFTG